MSLFHQLFVLGEEPISFAFGMHKIYRSLGEELSISVQEYLGLCFGKTSSLEVVTAVQQFMGVAWSLAAAFMFSPSGSLFPLSHLLSVMDLFSGVDSFQRP